MVVEDISQYSPCTGQQSRQAMSPAGTVSMLVPFLFITAAAPKTKCTWCHGRWHLMSKKWEKWKQLYINYSVSKFVIWILCTINYLMMNKNSVIHTDIHTQLYSLLKLRPLFSSSLSSVTSIYVILYLWDLRGPNRVRLWQRLRSSIALIFCGDNALRKVTWQSSFDLNY